MYIFYLWQCSSNEIRNIFGAIAHGLEAVHHPHLTHILPQNI